MAYLRREKELLEIDYPLEEVWKSIKEAVTILDWKTEETDEESFELKAKSKGNFMAYPSTVTINASNAGDRITRVTVSAETPTTTITGIVDFGRTRERIDTFLLALIKQLKKGETIANRKEKKSDNKSP